MVISISNCFTRRYQVSPMKGHFLSQLGCWGHQTWLMEIPLNLWACKQERVLHKETCPGSSVWLEGRYVQLAMVEVTTIHGLYILMICPFWTVKNSRFLLLTGPKSHSDHSEQRLHGTTDLWEMLVFSWDPKSQKNGFEWDRRCSSTVFEMEKWRTIKPKNGDLESLESTQFGFVMVINVYAISTSTWDVDKMRILYQMGPQQDTFHFTNLWASNDVKCMSWKKQLHLGENHIAIFENPTYHCITVTAISLIFLWHFGGPCCGVHMYNYIVKKYIHVYNYNIIVKY